MDSPGDMKSVGGVNSTTTTATTPPHSTTTANITNVTTTALPQPGDDGDEEFCKYILYMDIADSR